VRKLLIVANWKMNLNVEQASLLVQRLHDRIKIQREVEIVLCPSLVCLQPISMQIDRRKFRLGAQNAFYKDEGPYTGEVSFTMLRDLASYCIIGHSERRIYFQESLDTIRDKVAAAVRNDIVPILCVGENSHERQAGETKQVLHDQITTGLSGLIAREIEEIVIAYEPLWAISTFEGVKAKPDEVESAIKFIRLQVEELYGKKAAKAVRVLYGGSVDDQDVHGYLEVKGCDGALVGGASLNYYKFAGIITVAENIQHQVAKAKSTKKKS